MKSLMSVFIYLQALVTCFSNEQFLVSLKVNLAPFPKRWRSNFNCTWPHTWYIQIMPISDPPKVMKIPHIAIQLSFKFVIKFYLPSNLNSNCKTTSAFNILKQAIAPIQKLATGWKSWWFFLKRTTRIPTWRWKSFLNPINLVAMRTSKLWIDRFFWNGFPALNTLAGL